MFRLRIHLREGLIVVIASIAAALFIFRSYLFAGTLLFGDANFLWSAGQLHAELTALVNVWRTQAGGFSGAVTNATQSFILLQAIFSPLGIPLSTVLVWPALIAAAFLAMRKLAYALGARGWAAVIAAAFYAGNPWLWDQLLAGHAAICAATALAPVVFATLLNAYRARSGSGWLLLALCGLELLADTRIALFVYVIVAAGTIVGFVRLRSQREPHAVPFLFFGLAAPFAGVAANAWWTAIYAFAKTGDPVPAFYPPIEDITTYSGGADLAHVLVLSGYFLQFQWQRALQFGWPFFTFWYAAVVFMLVTPALLAKQRIVRWIATAAIPVALLASMGSHGIALDVLKWSLTHVPFMGLLREPVKYGFVVALGVSTLTALWLSTSGTREKWLAGAAVAIMLVPVFSGTLQVPDGHGLQVFTERPQFLDIANYVREHVKDGTYRIAFLPPWLAEQSLAPGEFFVDNPFAFQSQISEIDAKLINTSTSTDNAAWQAFNELYWGTDVHPAQTLARLGIRYLVIDDDVTLSPGAQYTSFARVPADEIHYLLAQDAQFKPVYHSGPYWIYEDTASMPLVRTASTPLLAGPIAPAVRAALPVSALGDDVERTASAQLPPGATAAQSDPLSACVDRASYAGLSNAYYSVGKHSDYTGYWVASDWMLRGENTLESRMLANFAPPYAFTRSASVIAAPIRAAKAGTLFAQIGSLGTQADVQIALDGGPAATIPVGDDGFHWYRMGRVDAGRHWIGITGNAAGVLAGQIAVVPGGCSAPRLAGQRYYLPAPLAAVDARLGTRHLQIASDGKKISSVSAPDGTAAFTIDDVAVSDSPVSLLRGVHRVVFFAPTGAPLSGNWSLYDRAPYQANEGSGVTPTRLTLAGGRWPQWAMKKVSDLKSGQTTMVRYTVSGSITGAQIEVLSPDGGVDTLLDVRAGTHYVLIPYFGPAYTVAIRVPGNSKGLLTIDRPAVTAASAIGRAAYFTVPSRASISPPTIARGRLLAHLQLNDDALESATGDGTIWTPLNGTPYARLQLRGVAASDATDVSVVAYYRIPFAVQQQWTVASVRAGTAPADISVDIPVLPHANGIALTLRPASTAVVRLSSAQLWSAPGPSRLQTIVAPPATATAPHAIRYTQLSPEKLRLEQPAAGWIVGDFTYDPYWTAGDAAHYTFDGHENAWYLPRARQATLRYTLQTAYRRLQLLDLLFFIVTFAAWGAARIRASLANRSGKAARYEYAD